MPHLAWQQFVLAHGTLVRKHLLAHLLQVPEAAIEAVRAAAVQRRPKRAKTYAELFSLWHGRAPGEGDWPAPRKSGRDSYEWFVPEITLLASLVGQLSVPQIAATLTTRLRQITGDDDAVRSVNAVLSRINQLGLQAGDLVGGLTVQQAGADIGSEAVVYQAIQNGTITPVRIGHRLLIPREHWQEWKATRHAVPKGYVRLASLRQPLGIKSDSKLPEFAAMGYIPTATRCNPTGTEAHSTRFGTWYVSAQVARRLVADRRAGRSMPWHGKPLRDNLRVTWRLYEQRRHPAECETCREIWGKAGAPTNFDDYLRRYPPLAHGAKRHLTLAWCPGWKVPELAAECGVSVANVRRAIAGGLLAARKHRGIVYITRTDATRWRARKCPTGAGRSSWITLASAKQAYGFKLGELRSFIADGKLTAKAGSAASKGAIVVGRQQCAQLRERLGFTEVQAAKRLKVTLAQFRKLLAGVRWRAAPRIPLATVRAVGKRLESQRGMTVPQAARTLRRTQQWIHERIADGTVRVTRARWDTRRLYLTTPMLERLRCWKRPKVTKRSRHWLALGEAAKLAGVSTGSLSNWADNGSLPRRKTRTGYRYHHFTVQARARRYWRATRRTRATPPAWFRAEQQRR